MNSSTFSTATLKTAGTNRAQSIPCSFESFQGKCLTLRFEERPSISGPVSVEYNDAMFLGEIVRHSSAGAACLVEIYVEQVLTGLESLLRFRAQLIGEGVGRTPEYHAQPVHA